MSAQVSPIPQGLPAAQLVLKGRVRSVRQFTNSRDGSISHFTLITLPAPDEFSLPAVVEISSGRALGRPGEDISVRVQLAGVPRTATSKPDAQGRVATWETATNLVRAVEA